MQLIRYSLYEAVVAVRNPKVNDEGVRFLLRFTARDSRMARRRLRDTIPGVTITKGPSRVPELKAEGKLFAEYSVQKNNRSIGATVNLKPTSLFREVVREFERRYLLVELHRNNWNRAETARELGIPYRTLLHKVASISCCRPSSFSLSPTS